MMDEFTPMASEKESSDDREAATPALWPWLMLAGLAAVVAGVTERLMGRPWICQNGTIRLWVNDIYSSQMSQQMFDWYSFSHLLHGLLFYAAMEGLRRLLGRRAWPRGLCLLGAVAIEGAWEILENSPFVINRYRQVTIALGYTGDSVLNSMSDIGCCVLGFALARRMPAWGSVMLFMVTEVMLAVLIRDNLTLNVLMLLYPLKAVKQWQMGG